MLKVGSCVVRAAERGAGAHSDENKIKSSKIAASAQAVHQHISVQPKRQVLQDHGGEGAIIDRVQEFWAIPLAVGLIVVFTQLLVDVGIERLPIRPLIGLRPGAWREQGPCLRPQPLARYRGPQLEGDAPQFLAKSLPHAVHLLVEHG